jgi:hypothetical protein
MMKSILIFAFLSLGLVAVVFSQTQTKERKVPSLTNDDVDASPVSGAFKPGDKPMEDIEKSIQSMTQIKAYRAVSYCSGDNSTRTEEWVSPDRIHVIMKGRGAFDYIQIGPVAYNKTADGQWEKVTVGGLPPHPDYRYETVQKTQAEYIGIEKLGDQSMLVYRFNSSGQSNPPSKIWISTNDGLPRRIEDHPLGVKCVLEFSDYNSDIHIDPPM